MALCLANMLRNAAELTSATTSDWSADSASEVRARSAAAASAVAAPPPDDSHLAEPRDWHRLPGVDVADAGLTNDRLLALLARLLALPDRVPPDAAARHPAFSWCPCRPALTSGSELESALDSGSVPGGAAGTTINVSRRRSNGRHSTELVAPPQHHRAVLWRRRAAREAGPCHSRPPPR